MVARDCALVAAAKRGDESAFRVLFRQVQPRLLRYLTVTAGPAADDLAAETWLSVVKDLDRFHGDEAGFRAWVLAIARHRRVDLVRARARDRSTPVESPPEQPAPDDVPAAVEAIVSTEAALALLAQLPPSEAEVVTLRVVVGLDVAAVAAVTGRRPGTVRVLAHRGLRRLAELVAPTPAGAEVTLTTGETVERVR
jgi:RNA polymerase sigma-70 factor (ECF subfamily)